MLPKSTEPLTFACVSPITAVALRPGAEASNATSIQPPVAAAVAPGTARSNPTVRSTPTAAPTSSTGA